MPTFVAIRNGFYDGTYREAGTVVPYPETEPLPTWLVEAGSQEALTASRLRDAKAAENEARRNSLAEVGDTSAALASLMAEVASLKRELEDARAAPVKGVEEAAQEAVAEATAEPIVIRRRSPPFGG